MCYNFLSFLLLLLSLYTLRITQSHLIIFYTSSPQDYCKALSSAVQLGLDRQSMHHLFPSLDHSCMNDEVRALCVEEIAVERKMVKEGDAKMHALLDGCIDSLTPISFYALAHSQLFTANVLLSAEEMKIGGSRVKSKANSNPPAEQQKPIAKTSRVLRETSCP
jgi:hypothetical protein